jgi:sulfofructose kinase
MSESVVGLGHATVSYLGVVSRYPEPENRRELRTFSIQGGGAAATAIAVLAGLGSETAFVGKVSDDDFGRYIVRSLGALGVDVDRVVVAPGFVSPFAFVTVEEGQAKPAVYYTRGNVPPLAASEVPLDLVDGAALLLVDGSHVRAQIAAAERARSRGVPVLLCAAGAPEGGLGDLIALADTLLLDERLATELSPRGELEDSLAELRAMGPRTVIIQLGDAGSIGHDGGVIVREPAFRAEVVEATGAADVYAGAFAYGALRGWPLERRMHFAAVAAGLSCRALGRRAALPDLNETLVACGWRA